MISGRTFLKQLTAWNGDNPRDLPWKETDDPYAIWLSEIILQQTQVAQGIPYYKSFLRTYPDVHALARASEEEVLRSWQGLGYNSRARNLHKAAKYIATTLDGQFPATYREILALPGIGPYTAAAISSFAFGLPYVVVDANVIRFIARLLGIEHLSTSQRMRSEIRTFLEPLIHQTDPAEFNQALMNFGAMHCKARVPDCETCPFERDCYARQNGMERVLPVKPQRKARRQRYFHYFFITSGQKVLLRQREEGDIWTRMFDFPLVELDDGTIRPEKLPELPGLSDDHVFSQDSGSEVYRQTLSHQEIHVRFYEITIPGLEEIQDERYRLVNRKNLDKFAFPKVINCYLQDKSIL